MYYYERHYFILQGDVFYRPEGSSGELVVIDREVLKVAEVYQCSAPGWARGLPFSDGINIGHISPDREVSTYSLSFMFFVIQEYITKFPYSQVAFLFFILILITLLRMDLLCGLTTPW